MLADIVKGARLAVVAANDDDALIEDIECDKGPRRGQFGLMSDHMPGPVEDRIALLAIDVGVVEEAGRQRIGMCRVADLPARLLFHHRMASWAIPPPIRRMCRSWEEAPIDRLDLIRQSDVVYDQAMNLPPGRLESSPQPK